MSARIRSCTAPAAPGVLGVLGALGILAILAVTLGAAGLRTPTHTQAHPAPRPPVHTATSAATEPQLVLGAPPRPLNPACAAPRHDDQFGPASPGAATTGPGSQPHPHQPPARLDPRPVADTARTRAGAAPPRSPDLHVLQVMRT